YVFDGNTFQMEIAQTGDTTVYQSQHDITQWFDVSIMTGIKLFPSSKNHVRILAGAGYSRLLADVNSRSLTPAAYDVAFTNSTGGASTSGSFAPAPVYSYSKNQLQLFSEIT